MGREMSVLTTVNRPFVLDFQIGQQLSTTNVLNYNFFKQFLSPLLTRHLYFPF